MAKLQPMSESNFNISIPKPLISEFETEVFPGEITVIDNIDDLDRALQILTDSGLVGFDTETKPTFRKGRGNPVALMQISTDNACFLIRLNKIGFPESLRKFLEDGSVTKIGLSLKDDFFVMHRTAPFVPRGFIDLQPFVRNYHILDCSLQRIYAIVFGKRISKGQRLSNWEAPKLTAAQQSYAAIDAWACLKLYNHLKDGLFKPEESPYIIAEEQEQ